MILMNDFKAEPQPLRDAMLGAVSKVLDSGWYVLGNHLRDFEVSWARLCGASYAVGVGNGMDAIEISLRALDIRSGDEVITTPMTAFATVLGIIRAGATPVLADIDPDTALLSLDSVERCCSARTKALVLVHLYGHVHNMLAWQRFSKERGIHLIEDCAQSHMASLHGKVAGTFGAAGAYSFYPTKNLGALGDAGILITDNFEHAERASRLRNYGQSVRYSHPELGMNSRLDELQAAILSERLKWLGEFTRRRQEVARVFQAQIRNPVVRLLSEPEEPRAHVYHLFVVTCSQRDALQTHLSSAGIQSLIHYPVPVHKQMSCLDLCRDPKGLSTSELHAKTCLSLPCHPQMTDTDVSAVVDAVNTFQLS